MRNAPRTMNEHLGLVLVICWVGHVTGRQLGVSLSGADELVIRNAGQSPFQV
jgi:hypothetical protein